MLHVTALVWIDLSCQRGLGDEGAQLALVKVAAEEDIDGCVDGKMGEQNRRRGWPDDVCMRLPCPLSLLQRAPEGRPTRRPYDLLPTQ